MKRVRTVFLTAVASLSLAFSATAADTIRIAQIDPMSGPFADVGERANKQLRGVIEEINAKGGVLGRKFELVTFDNKNTPQESLLMLNRAMDQGIHFIAQGNGSNNAGALIDAIAKVYQRTPEKAVLYLNYAAVDPDLTQEKCNFWHFRFDANTEMKVAAIAGYLATQKSLKRVYLIGQDYAHGRAVSAAARKMLAEKRPDIRIVGDDLHPVGKVKDFAPYIAKIKASGAQAVITGNWGNDLTLLVKAAKEAGLSVDWYTFYAGGGNTAGAIGEAGIGHVYQVSEYHTNIPNSPIEPFIRKFEKEYNTSFYYLRIKTALEMLARAMEQARSTDPLKVAKALEGMRFRSAAGEVWMRPEDHQMMMPQLISVMTKAGPKLQYKHDIQGSGYGVRSVALIGMKETILPNACSMARP
ncbi:branched-chain amino acid ABC transporter substrate-binding protein [Geobacter sp.]|uniref:branched-chain amino acid ABC transporter substrate-binding protein n=1 Tax=Geobacter sp. TaxID=46610 RepID=UPI00261F9A00|nr:branched-chain amino acid ABC transporter substrate-binding protein [Geobacter sp.]